MKPWLYTVAARYSKILLSGGVLVLLSACATGSDTAKTSAANDMQDAPPSAMDSCDTEAVSYAIGEAFDEANVPQLQSESQSRQVRILRPGDAATMDHRPDRLNVHLDSSDDIEALRCG
ncbi:I78 family peptidase inhibitor [Vreelandella zhanjiangensis]|uniref:I78 family peptidase inhibitor n=1 Tax=Vreelandella zhanjiangensis TaxID=1121960 RepID=UPI00402A8978